MSLDTSVSQPSLKSPPKAKAKRNKRTEARQRGREHMQVERRRLFLRLQCRNLPDDAVLTIPERYTLNSLSPRAGRRALASADGPVVLQLSPKRKGITVRANREWQERRARSR
jgi:hypothetical protein